MSDAGSEVVLIIGVCNMDDNKINDDNKLYRKYLNKKNNAKKENINFNLSYDEFVYLVKNANLLSSQLGFTGKNYVLARYNDTGDYSINNCRFISQRENIKEQKISNKSLIARRNNAKKMNEYNKLRSKEDISNKIKDGQQKSEKYQKRIKILAENKQEKIKNLNKSYIGNNNSQFGTYWITDGKINKKWKQEYGEIPNNFYRGRVINKNINNNF